MQDSNDSEANARNVVSIGSWRNKRRTTAFVTTATAQQILDALAFTMKHNDLAVIYGGPGVGKTRTVQHFREICEESKSGQVWLTTISPSIATVVPMLTAIGQTLEVVASDSGARALHGAICSRLATAKRPLLVIDEAQHLKAAALEELRALHDATGAGIAMVGNEGVYKRIAAFAQIHSRIGVRLPLPRPREADVETLVRSRWGAVDDDTLALLDQIAMLPGALRLVVKIMDAASSGSRTPGIKAVKTACKMLGVELGGTS